MSMAKTMPEKLKVILMDILGGLLIIAAGLFGWIPGPGGIPLLLGGLGLLAVNHKWARRLLEQVKSRGLKLWEIFFNDHPLLQWFYDIVGLGLIGLGVWLLNSYSRNLLQSLAIALGFVGLGLFLGNRHRLHRLSKHIKKALPFKK